jgi:zinc transport system ATP-binding protein
LSYVITSTTVKHNSSGVFRVLKKTENLLTLHDAGVNRAGRWLVRGVDFSVHAGEIVTLIGPNGSGKSSTIKLALGLFAPTEGKVTRRPDIRIGYVPQKISIDWSLPLRVSDFISLTQPVSEAQGLAALRRTGADDLWSRDMKALSGGEMQRVLLARAMVRKPELLVLDEPAQGVDFAGEAALYALIQDLRDELNCGVLLVSHDLHMVMAATDRVICLNGHMCCQGTPDVVANDVAFRQLFGERAGALAPYRHHHDHVHLADGRVQHNDGSISDHCHPGDGHHHDVPVSGRVFPEVTPRAHNAR